MAGRPKRTEAVGVVFLRLPYDLLERVNRCAAMIALHEGVLLDKTQAFRRVLEAGCEALEHSQLELAHIASIASENGSRPGNSLPQEEAAPALPVTATGNGDVTDTVSQEHAPK